MKIAIHNPFEGQQFAETELAARFEAAATTTGHECKTVSQAEEIEAFQPDFVLAMHPNEPKVSRFPTYGCMWSPPIFYAKHESIQFNVSSYDGYFFGSKSAQEWIADLVRFQPKSDGLGLMLPTTNARPFVENPRIKNQSARVAYFGSNWDRVRRRDFFTRMDRTGIIDVFGRKESWRFLTQSYKGTVPFDGKSVPDAISKRGIAICLHTQEHIEAALPTMRVFETTMSGSIALCDRHPFIIEHFGDTVLYLDDASDIALAESVHDAVAWVRDNPKQAIEKAAAAHEVAMRFSLEQLLTDAIGAHEGVITHPLVIGVNP